MIVLQYILPFFVVLGVLVVVHELGHYWAARWCGVKVLRFSVGMGKVIFSRRFGPDQTEWALSALPFGGYVKMLDAREEDVGNLSPEELKREFTRQNVWKRIAIVAAGPIANFLLAIVIFTGLYSYGMPEPVPRLRAVTEKSVAHQAGLRGGELITAVDGEPVQLWSDVHWRLLQPALERKQVVLNVSRVAAAGREESYAVTLPLDSLSTKDLESDFMAKLGLELARPKAILGKILPDGAGKRAGLHEGDLVVAVNERPVTDGMAFVELMRASPEQNLTLRIMRQHAEIRLEVKPDAAIVQGRKIGQIKVEVPMQPEMLTASYTPLAALGKGVTRTWDTSVLTLKMLGKMLIGEVSWKNITGPITIADYAGKTASIGLIPFLSFMALISISLGVMNLLPIPVLDGGLLLYYSLEVLTGRPLSERVGEIAQRAGIGLLMVLMMVAVFNDIARLIS